VIDEIGFRLRLAIAASAERFMLAEPSLGEERAVEKSLGVLARVFDPGWMTSKARAAAEARGMKGSELATLLIAPIADEGDGRD
jgi:hypothetical protein